MRRTHEPRHMSGGTHPVVIHVLEGLLHNLEPFGRLLELLVLALEAQEVADRNANQELAELDRLHRKVIRVKLRSCLRGDPTAPRIPCSRRGRQGGTARESACNTGAVSNARKNEQGKHAYLSVSPRLVLANLRQHTAEAIQRNLLVLAVFAVLVT